MKFSAFALVCLLLTSSLDAQTPKSGHLPDQIILAGGSTGMKPIPYTKEMTAVHALLQLGGITEDAPAKLYLFRCGRAERIDLRAVLNGDPSKDRALQPWDILYLNPPHLISRSGF